MQALTVFQRRKIALLVAAIIAAIGVIFSIHDALTMALFVGAAGAIWSSREWKAWLLAGIMVSVGLFWSSRDLFGCSVWWRSRIVCEKLLGRLPYVGWSDIRRASLSPCFVDAVRQVANNTRHMTEKVEDGKKLVQYQTSLGTFWMPGREKSFLAVVVWEITVQHDYEDAEVRVRSGDTVIDCGAHVGIFTRYALRCGAGRVVAIEPDPLNLKCLKANFSQEIQDGRVVVVEAGVWDRATRGTLSESQSDSGEDSFVIETPGSHKVGGLLLFPLDQIVGTLRLDRVDFIKMDIEGAEPFALRGCVQTLKRFRPRMAVAAYHSSDDVSVLPAIVKQAVPTYQIHGKDVEIDLGKVTTKVLFFH
jgi:FkbM family methyltransferase